MSIRDPLAKRVSRMLGRVAADTRGATAVEYGLIVALIVLAVMVAIIQVANITTSMWDDVNNKVTAAH